MSNPQNTLTSRFVKTERQEEQGHSFVTEVTIDATKHAQMKEDALKKRNPTLAQQLAQNRLSRHHDDDDDNAIDPDIAKAEEEELMQLLATTGGNCSDDNDDAADDLLQQKSYLLSTQQRIDRDIAKAQGLRDEFEAKRAAALEEARAEKQKETALKNAAHSQEKSEETNIAFFAAFRTQNNPFGSKTTPFGAKGPDKRPFAQNEDDKDDDRKKQRGNYDAIDIETQKQVQLSSAPPLALTPLGFDDYSDDEAD